ncbi:hypothetical protein FKZ61_013730 [Litorilinea aerophila]|uniref:hypothetical protein n=1 Tax=Litorilinea aerophila TaxID=1204385 RepID=UPI001E4271FD|nr:hypothetical protein [Litorilinea aerophila]MCC9077164.1 hypothetical protein [Litorilinea aerophila]
MATLVSWPLTLTSLAAGALYLFVGYHLSARKLEDPRERLAWRLFMLWWFGLAGTTLVSTVRNLLQLFGVADPGLNGTATYLNLLLVCAAVWGLSYYFLYLFTGNPRLLVPSLVFYGTVYVVLLYLITANLSATLDSGGAANGKSSPAWVLPALLLLIGPVFLGALGYLSLAFRIHDRSQQFRIVLVSGSILTWFLGSLLVMMLNASGAIGLRLLSQFLGLLAAIAVTWAYFPPLWIQRYLNVKPVQR